ncbi:MAG: modulator of FtsH protease HflC [Candidatus Atribacteria bacterium]|jgi:membrane protease subunit HflC|uniref:Protein HflC n=1 Tax=Thermatribacter velox TaxID=3039681 RepID=A0ABZ2YC23_9BACT|nr:modulator of FtsH protease HflC [Candidatus Atribacteria bacterium]MDI3530571.1 modulator of FtsH protease HflC [Candidatus Atribacteria bacterium]
MARRKLLGRIIIAIIGLIIVVLVRPWYTLDETEQGVLLQLGKPVKVVKESGLHLKLPYPIQTVYKFDKRLLEYDSPPEEVITRDKKTLVVDNYVRWRIENPLLFLQTVVSESEAVVRIDDLVYSELRTEIGKVDLIDVVATERGEIMDTVTRRASQKAKNFGIEIVDVRIKRADLPKQNEEAVFERMKAERERQAKQYRSEGQEEATKIRAQADKERALIIAEAQKQAQIIKGEGEAQALRIYAAAFGNDPEFFAFLKTLEMYEQGITENDTLVLTPASEILEYIESSRKKEGTN